MTHAPSVDGPSRTRTGLGLARFRPPAPPELEHWLARMIPPGAPDINVGGRVPCTGEPLFVRADPLDLLEPVSSAALRRSDRWFWTLMQDMEAAYMRDVQAKDSLAVRDFLGLRDQAEIVSYRAAELGGERERSRSADRRIKTGREAWRRFNGVPWVLVTSAELWRLGHTWWLDNAFIEKVFAPGLAAWHQQQCDAAKRRIRLQEHALRQKAQALHRAESRC